MAGVFSVWTFRIPCRKDKTNEIRSNFSSCRLTFSTEILCKFWHFLKLRSYYTSEWWWHVSWICKKVVEGKNSDSESKEMDGGERAEKRIRKWFRVSHFSNQEKERFPHITGNGKPKPLKLLQFLSTFLLLWAVGTGRACRVSESSCESSGNI